MSKFRAKLNVSQMVFLVLTIVLAFQTVYLTLNNVETSLFNNVMLTIIWFFFGRKTANKEDTLVEWDFYDDKI